MKLLKKFVKFCLAKVFSFLPQKYILFESAPDYSDNTWAVYDYIVKNRLAKNYKLIWVAADCKNVNKSIKTVVNDSKIINVIKYKYYIYRSKMLVFCNRVIPKLSNKQISLYLTHGSVAKNVVGKCTMPADLDYCLYQSEMLKQPMNEAFLLTDHTKMINLGYPRNDDLLLENNIDIKSLFDTEFEKIIVWYPTFRQHKNGERDVSSTTIPIIEDENAAKQVNDFAKEHKVIIVLKPHFAQDTSYIKDSKLSNIVIVNDDFLRENNIRSYQFVGLCDALLTDYSSIYYDYLLTDKPIGLTWDDYDEYAQREGFAVNMESLFAGGEKIYNVEDFCKFIKNVATGNDTLKLERKRVRDLTNKYQDANSSKRVAEFVINLVEKD